MHINFRSWERYVLKSLLHLLGPLLHKVVYIRHLLRVIHSGRWYCLMQILNTIDPARYFLLFLIGVLNRFDIHRCRSHNIALLDVSELDHCLVFWVQCRFV